MYYRNSKRSSYTLGSCANCILDVALKYLRMGLAQNRNGSSDAEWQGIKILISELAKDFCPESSPNEIAQLMFRKAAEMAQVPDPWREIRLKSNEIALSLVQNARNQIMQIQDLKTRLYEAIVWSVAGNALDYGTAGHEVTITPAFLQSIYDQNKKDGFKVNHFDTLWNDLNRYKRVLYICDNAGEIVFDKLVIEILISAGISVTAVVKGGPISNDAIWEDAEIAGLPAICKVITTGSPDLGFFPDGNSQSFVDQLKSSPLVIAKGQANWEAIYAYQDQLPSTIHFYSIMKLKCNVHADLFGLPKGNNIIYGVKLQDFRKSA